MDQPRAGSTAARDRTTLLLGLTAVAYAVLHHVGSLPSGLGGSVSGTRRADWIDLLTPVGVLVPAALTLRAAQVPAASWALFGAGAVIYAEGHGQHLAANSIGNTLPTGSSPVTHLWDEVMGHYVWYAGVALVVAALAHGMRGHPVPRSPVPYLLAVAVGGTWGTNAVGGGTQVASAAAALAAVVVGVRRRADLTRCLAVAGATALPVILVGAVQGPG